MGLAGSFKTTDKGHWVCKMAKKRAVGDAPCQIALESALHNKLS